MKVTTFSVPAQVNQNILIAGAPGSDRQPLGALTLDSPAFSHTDEECNNFIKILEHNKGVFHLVFPAWVLVNQFLEDHASSPLVTTYVAWLWGTVSTL